MNCKDALPLIHEFLDGDLKGPELLEMNRHLSDCAQCRLHFRQLERTEALVHALPASPVPDGMAERIMQALPRRPRKKYWMRLIRRHPAVSAAVMFVAVMFGALLIGWNQPSELVVKGNHMDQLVIRGHQVIVPAGHTVEGNLFIEHGEIQVDGNIQGDLVVIDGRMHLASTAYISGQTTRINHALNWLWYQVGQFITSLTE